MDNMKTKFLDPEEIAEDLSIKRRAVMALVRKGELPAYRFNSEVRVKQNDLETFVEKSKIKEED